MEFVQKNKYFSSYILYQTLRSYFYIKYSGYHHINLLYDDMKKNIEPEIIIHATFSDI